ncbi:MAG: tRNA lysidine(34) synthetase TilS [Saprospiraceae bacterium]|nr:tRNA lysidine(34) synthetase TilS [Saprospiraceae bacterium]
MKDAFSKFLSEQCLASRSERILLAVSGGVDSMVMAHLFRQAGLSLGMAHGNFQLRGEASDADEQLVREYAQQHSIPFYSIAFPTDSIAEQEGESIQITARRLRYEWLEKVRKEERYDLIATAHHLNDAAETVLYNLTKGCGIRGLHGIAARRERIIRPLLFATREEVEAFAHAEGILWREDASNAQTYYMRNKIRLEVVPLLKAINPQWEKTMAANMQRFRDTEALLQYAVAGIARRIVQQSADGGISIRLDELSACPAPATVLYEILHPYGFLPAQVAGIMERKEGQSGAIFLAPAHRLLIDRGVAYLEALRTESDAPVELFPETGSAAVSDGWFELEMFDGSPAVISAERHIAMLDTARLSWPLRLRRWKPGDYFCPIGMNGRRKKLQDFFTDEKMSRFEKEKTWVVETAQGEICWVAGYRTDDRFRITAQTRRHIVLYYRKNEPTL